MFIILCKNAEPDSIFFPWFFIFIYFWLSRKKERVNMTKKLLALVLSLALGAAVVGCGSSGGSGGAAPAPSGSGTAGNSASGSAKPAGAAPDNDLVIALNNDIQKLDPHDTSDTLSISVSRSVYEPLVSFDEEQNLVPMLAESWEAAEDSVTYTFKLRQDVTFSDGEPFNAEAVIANFDRVMANDQLRQYRRISKFISYTALDDYTVEIVLDEPNVSFLNQFTQMYFVSPKSLSDGTDLNKTGAGTGPFVFVERVEGDYVKYEPNANYWGEGSTVDSLTFRAVEEDGSRVAMLQTGEADYIYPMPFIQASSVDGTDNIKVLAMPSNIMRYITLNTRVEALSDVRVRQAMNYAFNNEAYIATVFNGYGEDVYSAFPSTIQYYKAHEPYAYDVEKAKQLLADAGYENGFDLTIWCDNTTTEQKGAQFFQQQMALIGINVEVLPMEPNTISDMIYVEENEATIETWYVNWSSSSFDPDGSMRNILHSEFIPPTSANTAYWENAEFDALLDEARASTDPAELEKLYGQAQDLVWAECPWVFMGSDQVLAAEKDYVSGISLRPDGSLYFATASLA